MEMSPRTKDTRRLEALIERTVAVFQADRRITATWLEGSFAEQKADAWSDVDVHASVHDEDYDAVVAERQEILARIGRVLGYGEHALPGGFLVFANLDGLLRLDVIFTKESSIRTRRRRYARRLLFEKTGLREEEEIEGTAEPTTTDLRPRIEALLREFLTGCFMPLRLAGRREWTTLQLALYMGVYQYAVPAWLAVDDPSNATRPTLHLEHFLSAERRRILTNFFAALHRTFKAESPNPDQLKALLEDDLAMIFGALKTSCKYWNVPYPADSEKSVLKTYRQELGLDVRPTD